VPKTKYLTGAFYAKITIHSIHRVTAASLAGGVASAKPRAKPHGLIDSAIEWARMATQRRRAEQGFPGVLEA
jgi:type IV secretory pathway TrbL component